MRFKTIIKNPMTQIIGRQTRKINNTIYTYAQVIENGRRRLIYVGKKHIAPTSVNTNQNIAYTIV